MKKRKARQAREAAHAAEAVTSTAAHDTGGADVDASDTPIVADDDGEDADPEADIADQVEIAELMYRAALTRDEIAAAREAAAAELLAAAEAREQALAEHAAATEAREQALAEHAAAAESRERAFAERAAAVEEVERLAGERVVAADARERAAAELLAAAEAKDQAVADRAAAVDARERMAAERDAIANSRDKAGAERDSIANARDRAAVERDSIETTMRSARGAAGSGDDLDPELERARLEAELQRAHLDALTGAFRREVGRLALRNEIERARRADGKFVIAFIDVDGLKGVNDRDGHAAGDRVLRMLAAIMRANLRPYDPIVRFGGDEFICGISSIDPGDVQHRIGVIDQSLRHATGVGITAGLASLTGAMESVDELTERADAALIEAKQNRD